MTQPYAPPAAEADPRFGARELIGKRQFWKRTIWISLAGVIIPPVFGIFGTVIGMIGAFGTLRKSGEADPNALAGHISFALMTTLWGLVVSAIALVPLIAAMIRFFTLPKVDYSPDLTIQPEQEFLK